MRRFLLLLVLFSSLSADDLKETQQYAEALFKRHFYKDAIVEFEKSAKSLNPKIRNHSYLRLSNCYEQIKQKQKALDYFLLYRPSGHTNEAQYKLKKALLYQSTGQDKEAIVILEQLKTQRNSKFWLSSQYYLAHSLLKIKELKQATELLTKLSKTPFDDPHKIRLFSLLKLAEIKYQGQDFISAKKHLLKINESKDLSPKLRQQTLNLLASTLYQTHEYSEAIKNFELLRKDFPESKTNKTSSFLYAKSLIENNQADKARLVLDKNDAKSHYLIAYSSLKKEQWPEAIKQLTDFCTQFPKSTLVENAQFFITYCCSKSQKHLQVIAHSEKSLNSKAKSKFAADTHLYRAIAYKALKNNKAALKEFAAAIKLAADKKNWPNKTKSIKFYAQTLSKEKLYEEAKQQWLSLLKEKDSQALAIEQSLAICNFTAKPTDSLWQLINEIKKNSIQLSEKQLNKISNTSHKIAPTETHKILTQLLITQEEKSTIKKLIAHQQFRTLNYQEALKTFHEIDDKELSAFDLSIIGFSYKKLKQEALALKSWNKAFTLGLPARIPAENLKFIARELLLSENFESSKNIYRKLQKSTELNYQSEASNALAFIALQQGQTKKALKIIKDSSQHTHTELVKGERLSTLAEIHLRENKLDLATLNIDKAMAFDKLSNFSKARLNYALALIHLKNKAYDQAHSYASRSYILFKNKIYSPKAMLIDLEALKKLNRQQDSKTVLKELKENYPELYQKL